ncbi:hypothetical protein DCAR_0832215 [Daucus carota subsp. sativus]|uniref:RRM domain-containing protein n=1 Tax=Daucus carota subsp. sativus TaxID=79200 RepID=A0AAF0XSW1_DAUCS|nr:hypothetical protein DCAR_0832215 [Daucus carota subsp. sativus]
MFHFQLINTIQFTLSLACFLVLLRHINVHTGTFAKPLDLHRKIGWSWCNVKGLLQKAKVKIFGCPKNENDYNNDVLSSVAEVMTTQENGSEKSGHGEASNTQETVVCSKNNIPPSEVPYKSGDILSDMMGDTVLDAKRRYNDVENKGSDTIQSSVQMISSTEDNSLSQAISNATENHCSEIMPNARTSTGVCDSPYQTGLPEAALDSSVNSVKLKGVLHNQNLFQKNKTRVLLKEFQEPFDKSEKLSSLIFEATRPWQQKDKEKMPLTGRGQQVENKMYVDRNDEKLIQPPGVEPENGHLESAGSSSETSKENVPNAHVSVENRLNHPDNQHNFLHISPDKVSDEDGKPASGGAAELSALFNNLIDHEAGKIMNKCNSLETDGHLEGSEEVSRENLTNPLDIDNLIHSIKVNPIGRQVASDSGSVISNKSDQNHYTDHIRVPSLVNIQNLNNGQQVSSSHTEKRSEKDSSVVTPVKIVNNNGKTCNQQKGNADSAALTANKSKSDPCVPPMRMRQLDKAQDTTSRESLYQNKVLVKFVHKDASEEDVINVLKCFGNILKIELSDAGQSSFKSAIVYFEKRQDMQKALQKTYHVLKGLALSVEAASSLESQHKKIIIPGLIGDPDAPVALLKNPTRTVAIKQMTCEICPRHIEEALAFCESNISGFFLGPSDSVAYVEFETEDGKERALAKQSIVVLGKHLFIFRVDAPRTTVVRIKTMSPLVRFKYTSTFRSLGKIRTVQVRSPLILDIHFCITEWPNMLQILNKLNGMQVNGMELRAEPAPIVPPDVLCHIYSQPEERNRLKGNMLRLLQKLEDSPFYREQKLRI